ncbi:hypothetical protein BGX38DRAFT_1262709 [Terfezia claveryi]|nr:hypothetical protein BGX38DRAFT_1262709 [Terfezia claveryi]
MSFEFARFEQETVSVELVTMADENSVQQGKKRSSMQQGKKRSSMQQGKKPKAKSSKSYTKFTIPDIPDIDKRLGIRFETLQHNLIPVQDMLDGQSKALGEDAIDEIKRRVYENIIDHIDAEGYPAEDIANCDIANINDLVYAMIVPIISNFSRKTCPKSLHLQREREIIALGSDAEAEAGRVEESIVMDLISIKEDRVVIVIEAERSALHQAMKQCLLSMFDMRGYNGSGKVFGFITRGVWWRMMSFDGTLFQVTTKFKVMHEFMRDGYEKWKKEFSVLVDCMVLALSQGGMVNTEAKSGAGIVNTEAKSDGGIVNTEAKNDQKFSTIRTTITPHLCLHTLASTSQQLQSNSGSRPAETIAAAAAATILPNLANSNKTTTNQTATNIVPLKAYYPQDVLPWGRAMPAASVNEIPILRPTKYAGVMTQPTRMPPTHLMLTGVNENNQFQMSRPGDPTLPRPLRWLAAPRAWPQPVIATSAGPAAGGHLLPHPSTLAVTRPLAVPRTIAAAALELFLLRRMWLSGRRLVF